MPGDRFYKTKEWATLRAAVRKNWRLSGAPCYYCKGELDWKRRHAVSIDHIQNRKQHPELALVMSNLAAVCHTCNSKKAAWEEKDRGIPRIGVDGFPVGGGWGSG